MLMLNPKNSGSRKGISWIMPKSKKKETAPEKKVHKKKKTNWILSIGAIAFVIAIAVMIVDQHVRITESRKQLAELQEQVDLQVIKNDELKDVAEAVENEDFDKYSDYIEKRARIYGFTKDGEVVFINIAGN